MKRNQSGEAMFLILPLMAVIMLGVGIIMLYGAVMFKLQGVDISFVELIQFLLEGAKSIR